MSRLVRVIDVTDDKSFLMKSESQFCAWLSHREHFISIEWKSIIDRNGIGEHDFSRKSHPLVPPADATVDSPRCAIAGDIDNLLFRLSLISCDDLFFI